MKRDYKALDFCLKNISDLEPCSVVEIDGLGIKIIFNELVERIKKNTSFRVVNVINARNSNQIRSFLKKIELVKNPQTVVFYLSTNEDCSWMFNKIDELRALRSSDFTFIVFIHLGDVYGALESRKKGLFRSMKVLEPIDLDDTITLIKDFVRRFSFKPNNKQVKDIFDLSGGHVGLIKSIYFYLKENPKKGLTQGDLLKTPSIVMRLEGMIENLPVDLVREICTYPDHVNHKEFLEAYHFVSKGKILTPLLKEYLRQKFEQNIVFNNLFLETELTTNEKQVFEKIRSKNGGLITREEIATVIWGVNWEDQYSEWAIDQTIHRIREKLFNIKAPYKILTKKGSGFIFQEK